MIRSGSGIPAVSRCCAIIFRVDGRRIERAGGDFLGDQPGRFGDFLTAAVSERDDEIETCIRRRRGLGFCKQRQDIRIEIGAGSITLIFTPAWPSSARSLRMKSFKSP